MALIKEVAFHLKDEPPNFILVSLRVATYWASEVPKVITFLLELLQSWGQHIEIFDLSIHRSRVYTPLFYQVITEMSIPIKGGILPIILRSPSVKAARQNPPNHILIIEAFLL
jgi:hypothetical protein